MNLRVIDLIKIKLPLRINFFSMKDYIKSLLKIQKCFLFLFLITLLFSCKDKSIYDGSKPITDNSWHYSDKKDNYVAIGNNSIAYNLYLNVRITTDYKYSNLFVLLHIYPPGGGKVSTQRLEFKLANPEGKWLGSGSGTIYTYQIPFARDVKFDKAGVYNFQLEQNMRDEPLRDIVDIGIRIEKAGTGS